MVSAAAPEYDRLSKLLEGVELAPSAAEAQGMLCGLLALHLPDPLERWHAQLLVASAAGPEPELGLASNPAAGPDAGWAQKSPAGLQPTPPSRHRPGAPAVIDLTHQGRSSRPTVGAASGQADADAHHHEHHHGHEHCPACGEGHDQEHDHDHDGDRANAEQRGLALEQLAAWTQAAIDPPSVSFDLFLPPDDRPLYERASAVLDWLRGLLFGLALGGLDRGQLLGQTAEAFDDLIELTRMDLEAIAEDDANEQALAEIVEFLRVAAMLIREDRGKALLDERDRQAAETGLH